MRRRRRCLPFPSRVAPHTLSNTTNNNNTNNTNNTNKYGMIVMSQVRPDGCGEVVVDVRVDGQARAAGYRPPGLLPDIRLRQAHARHRRV